MTYRTTARGEWVAKDRRLSHEELMVLARLNRESKPQRPLQEPRVKSGAKP